jgi:DNA adenine methylase
MFAQTLEWRKTHRVLLFDTCEPLIEFYRNLQRHGANLIDAFHVFRTYHSHGTYKLAVDLYNDSAQGRDSYYESALFLYLNYACFNGLYRENSGGYFNVAIGRSANGLLNKIPQFDAHTLYVWAAFLDRSTTWLQCCDALDLQCPIGAFIYADPVYPNTFSNYSALSKTQTELSFAGTAKWLEDAADTHACQFMLSYLDVPELRAWVATRTDLHVYTKPYRHTIGGTAVSSKRVTEIIVTNYKAAP